MDPSHMKSFFRYEKSWTGEELGLPYQRRDFSRYAVFYVFGPQHLGDVHGQEEGRQQEGFDRGDPYVLYPFPDADVHGEVVGLTRQEDRESTVSGDQVPQNPRLLGLDDGPKRRRRHLRLVPFRLQLLHYLLGQLVQVLVLTLKTEHFLWQM